MTQANVSLPVALQERIQELIQEGGAVTRSEVIRAGTDQYLRERGF